MSQIPKKVYCRKCNAPMDKSAKLCPSCGAKNKKPFYKRAWFVIIIIIAVAGGISSIGKNISEKKVKMTEYRWPASKLASLIPQPQSKYGKVYSESETDLFIDIYDMTSEQFEDYIEECKERGFTEDYTKLEEYYQAENAEGFVLGLSYAHKEEKMNIMLRSPAEESPESKEETRNQETEEAEPEMVENEDTEIKDIDNKEAENKETEVSVAKTDLVDGMRPEFKEAMDSYEAFYNEYCDLMKKTQENTTDLKLIAEYADMLEKAAEMDEKFEAWEGNDLNNAELKYYAKVHERILQKLLEVGGK